MAQYSRKQVDHWDREDELADLELSHQHRVSLALRLFALTRSTRMAGLKLEHPSATLAQLQEMFEQELDHERQGNRAK